MIFTVMDGVTVAVFIDETTADKAVESRNMISFEDITENGSVTVMMKKNLIHVTNLVKHADIAGCFMIIVIYVHLLTSEIKT